MKIFKALGQRGREKMVLNAKRKPTAPQLRDKDKVEGKDENANLDMKMR